MKDDRFAEQLSALIRELDPPPPAPRDAMWTHIEAARQRRRPASSAAEQELHEDRESTRTSGRRHGAGKGAPVEPRRGPRPAHSSTPRDAGRGGIGAAPRPRRNRWLRQARWAAPLAAALLIGIGIGRVFGPAESGPAREQTTAIAEGGAAAADLPYRLVAAEHLDAAEALLLALPHDAGRGDVDVVSDWADELLVTTRLLLDSPAADDPHMATLFQDLELVLAQIASIPAADADGEVELIEEGIRQNNVLLRVRAATMQRPAAGT